MIGILLNPRSGYVAAHGLDHVQALIADALPAARVHLLRPDDDVAERCRDFVAAGATCIVAAGGDGTVNAVAAQLAGTPTPLGVIPVGTLNHFARDVGVGRDVPAALRVLAEGYVAPVDVAMVNDRLFVNNSSIGIYARMVEVRERYERRLGKWRALAYAAWLVGRHAQTASVSISDGTTTEQLRTYILFVGNNQYELDLLRIGQRTRLDAGELCCYIVEGSERLPVLRHIFAYLRDTGHHSGLFRVLRATRLTVTPASRHVDVACDGEVFRLTTPLVYRVLPRALRVVVPEPPPPESREVRSAGEGDLARSDDA